jgi:carbon storage regulator
MLVLSRKAGERIQIGHDVTITVTEVRGNRVRIGIDAPPGRRIVRHELLARAKTADAAPPVDAAADTGFWIDCAAHEELLAAV